MSPAAIDLIDQAQRASIAGTKAAKSLLHHALCLQEQAGGYYNEGTSRVYFLMAWHHYERKHFLAALTYFLQCLRISIELYGLEHCTTQLVLDDIRDLLEDMNLNEDCVNPVFDSWTLQDMALDGENDHETKTNGRTEEYWQKALHLIPADLDLERARIFIHLAQIYQKKSQTEQALSYFCQALMILPRWYKQDHPQLISLKNQAQHVASSLTPMVPRSPISSTSNQAISIIH